MFIQSVDNPYWYNFAGLYDTVFDVDHDWDRAQAQGLEPNGFSFDGADAGGVDYALNRWVIWLAGGYEPPRQQHNSKST